MATDSDGKKTTKRDAGARTEATDATEMTERTEDTTSAGSDAEALAEAPKPNAPTPRRRARAPKAAQSSRPKGARKTSTKAAAEDAPAEPPAEAEAEAQAEAGVVLQGRDIRHEDAGAVLSSVDVGPAGNDTEPADEGISNLSDEGRTDPGILTSSGVFTESPVIFATLEDVSSAEAARNLDAADVIVEMLNDLAGTDSPSESQLSDVSEGAVMPVWYVMVHQVEDAERTAATRRKAGRLAKKLARQIEKATTLLHAIFEAATGDAGILARHERPIARLIALLEVTPPTDKPGQRMFADLLRTERRALARAVKGK